MPPTDPLEQITDHLQHTPIPTPDTLALLDLAAGELDSVRQRYTNALQTISYWAEVAATGHRAIEVLQSEVRKLTNQIAAMSTTTSNSPNVDTKQHVETLLDDLAKGRVSPAQMDTINEAIRRARADHALGHITKR